MNAEFRYDAAGQSVTFTDEGITYRSPKEHVFCPYGSFKSIKLSMLTGLQINLPNKDLFFAAAGQNKKLLKEAIAFAEAANKNAGTTVAVELPLDATAGQKEVKRTTGEMAKLEKNAQSIIAFFGGMADKKSQVIATGIPNIVDSMGAGEEILHAFKGFILYINGRADSVVNYIGLITNKRFYYAGLDGQAILAHMKSGMVELNGAHSIMLSPGTMGTAPFVQFEVKNENYRLTTNADPTPVKAKLEEAIRLATEVDSAPTIVQAAVSPADELKKFKELLDMGVITQEEFDAKKKQLLGL